MQKDDISIKFGVVNAAEWVDVNPDAPFPLQQHPCYGLALQSFNAATLQATFHIKGILCGRALLVRRRFMGLITLTTIFRGPVWCDASLTAPQKLDILKQLKSHYRAWRWNFLAILPEEPASKAFTHSMKQAGFRQVMGGFSTIWLDIRPSSDSLRESLKGKWRNQLTSIQKGPLTISLGGRKPHHYSWLLEKEGKQRRERRYQALPVGLVPAYVAAISPKNSSGILSVTAIADKRKVAGALFLLHGNSATYHIGWAGEEGRNMNAQNRVLWEGICALKAAGIEFLDLGGINTADMAGIARFKLGLGADPLTLAGTFI